MANRRKGFTLAELLIVVAIIGVLVAVSIPIFNEQLKKARIATDNANMRSAKAAAVTNFLSGEKNTLRDLDLSSYIPNEPFLSRSKYYIWYYDAARGLAVPDIPGNPELKKIQSYGEMRSMKLVGSPNWSRDHRNQYIVVAISEDGEAIAFGWTYAGINMTHVDWRDSYYERNEFK